MGHHRRRMSPWRTPSAGPGGARLHHNGPPLPQWGLGPSEELGGRGLPARQWATAAAVGHGGCPKGPGGGAHGLGEGQEVQISAKINCNIREKNINKGSP